MKFSAFSTLFIYFGSKWNFTQVSKKIVNMIIPTLIDILLHVRHKKNLQKFYFAVDTTKKRTNNFFDISCSYFFFHSTTIIMLGS